MDKAIFRIAKINNKRGVRAALAHNLRLDNTPNINTELSHLNSNLNGMKTMDECMARYDAAMKGLKVRKNAVLMHEAIVTASPEKMAEMTPQERTAYFRDAARWLVELHGGDMSNLISMSIHNDESNPHAHILLIPKLDNKLNSRAIIGGHRGRLSELQTEFYEQVACKHGLTRGEKNSRATHRHYSDMKSLQNRVQELTGEVESLTNDRDKALREYCDLDRELIRVRNELERAKTLGLDELRGVVNNLEQSLSRSSMRPR